MHRKILLGSTMMAGLMLAAAPTFAQTAQTQPQATPDKPTSAQEVVVTGSRIPHPNLQQPTPVQTLSATVLQNAGTANLEDILVQLPAIGFSGTLRANSNNFGNTAGIASINLRNLGLSRTLVLVDGYRHVAGDINTDAVDINSIPAALTDRVEVITGGASAIYGSDAVTGVVNIVLKKKFEGIDAEAQIGADDGGYGAQYSGSVTVGHNFLDDKLNINLTGYWTKQAGVDAHNIPNSANYGTIINPADTGPNDGIPDRLYVKNVGSEFVTLNGVLLNVRTEQPQFSFNQAGQVIPGAVRTGDNSFAFGQLPTNCQDCYFTEDYEQETSPFRSGGLDFRANYEITPHIRAFVDAKYAESDTVNTIQPSFSFGDFQLEPDNGFIAPDLRAGLNAINCVGTAADATANNCPLVAKFLNPGRVSDSYRRTYRIVAGVEGDFDTGIGNIKWDAALNYGRTVAHIKNTDLELVNNFAAALDSVTDPVTGKAACRINVPTAPQTGIGAGAAAGCVPYNPFGRQNSAAALAYSFGDFDETDSLSEEDFTLNARMDTGRFFNLPGGPVGIATGFEYRMERTFSLNDPRILNGDTENLGSNSSGGFNVYEGYIEGNFPFFHHNGPWLDEVSLDVAYRGAQYSYQQVGYADAYKFSGIYGPFDWIKLRGTFSRSIRAPNITEAFLPNSGSFFNITDPCSVENINLNVNYAKNCAAAGLPAGFVANTNASITGTQSGNPNLQPEKSISYTAGFVLQPTFIPRLSITVDYYAIKIKDAITLVSAQSVINNCFGSSAGLDPTFCSLLTRSPTTQNINFVATTYENASKLETQGVDVQVDYSVPVSGLTSRWNMTKGLTGRLNFDLTANYLIDLRNFPFQSNPGQQNIEELTVNNPRLKALLDMSYSQGPWQVVYGVRYVGRVANFDRDGDQQNFSETTNVPFIPARVYHNLAVHYRFDNKILGNTEIYGGVNNLFGDLPPAVLIGTGADLGYDLGRFWFAGIKIRR